MNGSIREPRTIRLIIYGCLLVSLYLTTLVNYLLFHSLAEIFSIVVAFSFFTVTWNSKAFIKNQYLLFVGIAYLFIAFLDLMHTLSYKGMPIFTDYDYYANQLWIAARYLESLTLLAGFLFLGSKRMANPNALMIGYAIVTCMLMASIFVWKAFPVCFVEGQGLTPFKKISEYVICALLAGSLFLLSRNKDRFDYKVYRILIWSIVFTILSELAFTFYISNYGFSNLIGHYFKLFSFYLVYLAIVDTGIKKPYKLIFKELEVAHANLKAEIQVRIDTEKEREKLIQKLQSAIAEIKTLGGLLPICSYCKNVRDDKGYWNQIETYIAERSEVAFSHGICDKCAKTHFPDMDLHDD